MRVAPLCVSSQSSTSIGEPFAFSSFPKVLRAGEDSSRSNRILPPYGVCLDVNGFVSYTMSDRRETRAPVTATTEYFDEY